MTPAPGGVVAIGRDVPAVAEGACDAVAEGLPDPDEHETPASAITIIPATNATP